MSEQKRCHQLKGKVSTLCVCVCALSHEREPKPRTDRNKRVSDV